MNHSPLCPRPTPIEGEISCPGCDLIYKVVDRIAKEIEARADVWLHSPDSTEAESNALRWGAKIARQVGGV